MIIQTIIRFYIALAVFTPLSFSLIHDCALYLAPSSQSKDDQLLFGVYAGDDYREGDAIGHYELAIPVIDIGFHNRHRIINDEETDSELLLSEDQTLSSNFFDLVRESLWSPEQSGAHLESLNGSEEEGNVMVSIPGIPMLARAMPNFISTKFNQAWALNRTLTLDGVEQTEVSHPGRGAYSSYAPIVLEATQFIAAGSEIFMNYGNRDDEALDYEDIDRSLRSIQKFFVKYQDQLTQLQQQQLYSFLLKDVMPYSGDKTDEDQTDLVKAFPDKVNELNSVLDRGGSFVYQNPQVFKTQTWLRENGQCMDNLYPGISTIPNAGRGAFTKRNVSAGQVIAPMPLLKIDDKTWLNMYKKAQNFDEDGKPYLIREDMDDEPTVMHQQLLLNYCYGHPESSVLLHPMGSVVNMINHKRTGKGANVVIAWSNQPFYKRDLFNQSFEEFNTTDGHYVIGFDLIALRDIGANEEVFLDYGIEWEQAWNEHVDSWPELDRWPYKAVDLNEEIRNDNGTFYTKEEREELDPDPYPENIETVCQIIWVEKEQQNGTVFTFNSTVTYEDLWISDNMYRCDILQRDVIDGGDIDDVNDYFYTVNTLPDGEVIENVPHRSIRFSDKAYTSDMHNPIAFRYPIGIPDSMFPEAWKDLKF